MGRKATKCTKKCSKHTFSLKANFHSPHFCREVQASFCPLTLNQSPVFPTFNRDRKHYTSSFTLHHEKEKYEVNDALYKAEHDRFCQEQLEGKSIMFQPKPRSKNYYCHVCKDHYQDYLTVPSPLIKHISSPAHKVSIKNNRFTYYIDSLIQENFSQSVDPQEKLEEITLEKEVSTTTVSSLSLNSNNENFPEGKFQTSFTSYGWKGVFQPCFELKNPNRIEEADLKQRMNEEKVMSTPSVGEKKTHTIKPIVLYLIQ